jgi:hypothetical protein
MAGSESPLGVVVLVALAMWRRRFVFLQYTVRPGPGAAPGLEMDP